MNKRFPVSPLMVALVVLLGVRSASPHLNDFTRANGTAQPDRWPQNQQITWNLNPAHGTNVIGNRAVADVIQAAFNTWTVAPNASLNVARGNDSSTASSGMDGANLICFVCTGDFSSESETLAVTMTTTATAAGGSDGHGGTVQFPGQILDADILFNPSNSFTTDTGGGGVELQTVATHEIGHFFGLAHSAVVRAVMYPFSPNSEITLGYDDVAAISVNYPKSDPEAAMGSISGTVRMGGSAIFGAHVFADSATANEPFAAFNVRKTPIGAVTLPDGTYVISGLPADSYTVTAEPLDSPVSNSDISGYARAFGQSAVQTNFTTRWH